MENSQKNKHEPLLGAKKLTMQQIDEMSQRERVEYLNSLTAEEEHQYFMAGFISTLNNPEAHDKSI